MLLCVVERRYLSVEHFASISKGNKAERKKEGSRLYGGITNCSANCICVSSAHRTFSFLILRCLYSIHMKNQILSSHPVRKKRGFKSSKVKQ